MTIVFNGLQNSLDFPNGEILFQKNNISPIDVTYLVTIGQTFGIVSKITEN